MFTADSRVDKDYVHGLKTLMFISLNVFMGVCSRPRCSRLFTVHGSVNIYKNLGFFEFTVHGFTVVHGYPNFSKNKICRILARVPMNLCESRIHEQ